MIWWTVGIVIYWINGLILVHRSGWTDDLKTNLKLAVICGLGWPFVIVMDWFGKSAE